MRQQSFIKKLVYTQQSYNLYHYHQGESTQRDTLLIVFSLMNKPTVLDLHPERSLIRQLLAQGLQVFLLEWNHPALVCQPRGLADYILGDLQQAVEVTCRLQKIDELHLLGICQGGYFALCLSAINATQIASVIAMVTPIQFESAHNPLTILIKNIDVDAIVDFHGGVSGHAINGFLMQIDPLRLWQTKWQAWQASQKSAIQQQIYAALEAWSYDCPDQDPQAFREFIRYGIQQNALIKGELFLQGNKVNLAQLSIPLLNIYATEDYLWPIETTQALAHYHQSRHYQEYAFQGGHIGVMVSQRALTEIPFQITNWIKTHSRQQQLDYMNP